MTEAAGLNVRMRQGARLIGYWTIVSSPLALERLSSVGYDFLAVDLQHGEWTDSDLLTAIRAADVGRTPVLVRVVKNDPALIGRALDAGARGVVVPLIESAADVAVAVGAAHYPPLGARSFGPLRGPNVVARTTIGSEADALVIGMIETEAALGDLEAICRVPGLDGLYVGPSDLSIALGAPEPEHASTADSYEHALATIRRECAAHNIAVGIHVRDGRSARRRLQEGFTFTSIASDLAHLLGAAQQHLEAAGRLGDDRPERESA